ncbi:hypothetical protein IAT38_001425 [Cryptococcus sp. DSM 104549]
MGKKSKSAAARAAAAPPATPSKPPTTNAEDAQAAESSTAATSPASPKVTKKQTVDELREGLSQMGLDTKGKKETLWRRLVNAIQRASARDNPSDDEDSLPSSRADDGEGEGSQEVAAPPALKQKYKSFLCFDVEATCRPGKEFDWPNEIIEFPVVLLRWTEPDAQGKTKLEKVDQFRSYVRPTWSPKLSEFCISLTGITQETVDNAPTFPEMLKELEKWMDKWDLRDASRGLNSALWVTDGPWDLRDFVPKQLHITPPTPHPNYLHGPYLNLKHAVQSVLGETHRRKEYAAEHPDNAPNALATAPITTARYGRRYDLNGKKDSGPDFYFNLLGMREALNLGEFEGRQHSGLDDATNIASILIALSERNVLIEANGRIQPLGHGKRYPWMGKKGEVNWEEWMSSNQPLKPRGSAAKAEAGDEKPAEKEKDGEKKGAPTPAPSTSTASTTTSSPHPKPTSPTSPTLSISPGKPNSTPRIRQLLTHAKSPRAERMSLAEAQAQDQRTPLADADTKTNTEGSASPPAAVRLGLDKAV